MAARRSLRTRIATSIATAAVACGAVLCAVAPATADTDPVPEISDPLPAVEVTRECRGVVDLGARKRKRLVRLTAPSRLDGLRPIRALRRGERIMARVAPVLLAAEDRRGIFALFYNNILGKAVPALGAGSADRYDDLGWSRLVSITFFRPYLEGLHASLAGTAIPVNWRPYYRMAADCSVRPGRVAMAGLDAHLILDFPVAIAESGATQANFDDYYAIGELLQDATLDIGEDLRLIYGADLTEFFHLWFLGDALDAVVGSGVTTTLLFQGIRTVAFTYGLGLGEHALLTRVAMKGTYVAAETVSDALACAEII
ncbi:DUF5995 family protein [Nocardioides sp. YIM 152588]|uniref:DUF5995 family protein n=1 Tax=Nocardioides sp. YIM 152588 TaxID=3158259 RepID=UPI0032E3EE44